MIDDERYLRELLREMLEAWGCVADVAPDGAEGIARFAGGGYDLVLTDFLMPGVSGLEVVEAVRRSDPAVGVVMLTASLDDLDAYAEQLGFTLLRKPLDFEGLRAAVMEALAGRALTPAPAVAGGPTGPRPRTPLRP
ncbi:MAG: hypothetical protein A3E31_12185 [Candidatus Rokubacteria bacterium RIFCSPHIGHO2_12_FULL_73_22]|nr:MAG: hypothetical protein A3E31_12185 [Candidatus Rokubacteria bacterium RIFCSPHIGHO2_12_FULL_73_22]OGL02923.1 MAG: hypothetical protein A3D33_07300 [Candidatus Rokubacteria bacterium RIFCSPHIGHO2_02_FULL_73_26]OGL12861.1 MAG: hypothetical protein A3I14_10180 [Candidatus Rokubacteria bacterium RIFCSPLOWO2_02_FULL_73_56]OGL29718.1 MAG: hypothetical protein A3G44_12120 [Candidatus Rokubacteria bacterium RIFCSPLOWO2_12_FULL_73_47]